VVGTGCFKGPVKNYQARRSTISFSQRSNRRDFWQVLASGFQDAI